VHVHFAQVIHANDKQVKETILDDTDCPLQILRDWTSDKGQQNTLLLILLSFLEKFCNVDVETLC